MDFGKETTGWRKSSASGTGNCVEVNWLKDGTVLVRDSKTPDGPRLTFTKNGWEDFLDGVKQGEFEIGGS